MGLQAEITGVLASVNTLNSNLTPIIGRESTVKSITDREKARLEAKKTEIDDAYNTNKRLVDLNDSYRKKQSQYNYLMFVVISFFVIMIIMMQIQKAVPAIGGILTFITFILAVLVFAYVLYILVDIYRRDPNDFDKINYAPPPNVDKLVIDPVTGKASTVSTGLVDPATGKRYAPGTAASSSRSSVMSSGQDACFTGHSYDYYSGKCIPDCTAANHKHNMMSTTLYNSGNVQLGLNYNYFTSANLNATSNTCTSSLPTNTKVCGNFYIPSGYTCGAAESFEGMDSVNVSPNSPNEFSNYSRL